MTSELQCVLWDGGRMQRMEFPQEEVSELSLIGGVRHQQRSASKCQARQNCVGKKDGTTKGTHRVILG